MGWLVGCTAVVVDCIAAEEGYTVEVVGCTVLQEDCTAAGEEGCIAVGEVGCTVAEDAGIVGNLVDCIEEVVCTVVGEPQEG